MVKAQSHSSERGAHAPSPPEQTTRIKGKLNVRRRRCASIPATARHPYFLNCAANAFFVAESAKHQRTEKRPLSSRRPLPRIASMPLAQCHSYMSSSFLPKPPNG